MASTSTNKAPLLIDRPLLSIERLDGTSTPTGSVDPGSGTNARLLVDCTNNDGALIECIALIERLPDAPSVVNLYLSRSSLLVNADAYFLGRVSGYTGSVAGDVALFALLPILAPVPAASPAEGTAVPQFQGLRLARGLALWAACDTQTPAAGAPNILVQGGFY
jgi:hypothetical protein